MPSDTEGSIVAVHGPHLASTPDLKLRRNKLVISISGTGGGADAMIAFDSVASLAGFHTISLDYKNEVITTVCRFSRDSSCYDSFRREIVFGTPVSDTVHVDSVNSLYNRIYRLLTFLSAHFPMGGWEHFYKDRKMIWTNIIAVGHSQGAGHAAYLGKNFALNKVIILAGPQDFLDHFNKPAPWISGKSKTAPGRYFALLHPHDPFGFEKQLSSCLLLSQSRLKYTISANASGLKGAAGNILITHVRTNNPHGSVMLPVQAEAWRYMLDQ